MITAGLRVSEEDLELMRSLHPELQKEFPVWDPTWGWVKPEQGVDPQNWASMDSWYHHQVIQKQAFGLDWTPEKLAAWKNSGGVKYDASRRLWARVEGNEYVYPNGDRVAINKWQPATQPRAFNAPAASTQAPYPIYDPTELSKYSMVVGKTPVGGAGGEVPPLTPEGAEFLANRRSLAANLALMGDAPERATEFVEAGPLAGETPEAEFMRIARNPRSMTQALLLLGYQPEQIEQYYRSTPMYQQLTAGGGQPQVGIFPGEPGYQEPQGPNILPWKMPVRQTMQDIQTQSPRVGALESLFSFYGYQPESAFGQWSQYLPKGAKNPLTRYV